MIIGEQYFWTIASASSSVMSQVLGKKTGFTSTSKRLSLPFIGIGSIGLISSRIQANAFSGRSHICIQAALQSDLLKGLISASFTTQSPWPGMVPLIFFALAQIKISPRQFVRQVRHSIVFFPSKTSIAKSALSDRAFILLHLQQKYKTSLFGNKY